MHSQHGQDEILDSYLFRGLRDGVFVDVGAHDGISLSNTLFYERSRNWTGVCVEAHPARFAELRKNRPRSQCFHAAAFEHSGASLDFVDLDGPDGMLSGLATTLDHDRIARSVRENGGTTKTIKVPGRSLRDLLDEARIEEVHYLSMDIEGGEVPALRGMDFGSVLVHAMSIECNRDTDASAVLDTLGSGFIFAGRLYEDIFLINRDSRFGTNLPMLRSEIKRASRMALPLRARLGQIPLYRAASRLKRRLLKRD